MEQLEAEQKRLEIEKTKAEINYWASRQQANAAGADGDEPVFGLASNKKKYGKRFVLPKSSRRPSWK
jgi:hypothetical protein